jgi:23S rRNA (uridine2552-2'-O)-methyltransferase
MASYDRPETGLMPTGVWLMGYERADSWTRRAKEAGFAARSVFKLDEIDRRFPILPRGSGGRVLDLGCFPGSWSKWLLQRGLRVVGVDLKAPDLPGGTWIARSVDEVEPAELLEALGGPADLVVSDMAPNTSGNRFTDHVRQIALADRALTVAEACLRPGGHFVCKVFDGADAPAFTERVKARFEDVRRFKPEATRDRSVEFFLIGRGFR